MNKTDPRLRIKTHKHAIHHPGQPLDLVAYIVTLGKDVADPTHDQLVEMGVPVAAIPAEVKNHQTGPGVWTFAVRVPSAVESVCWFCGRG